MLPCSNLSKSDNLMCWKVHSYLNHVKFPLSASFIPQLIFVRLALRLRCRCHVSFTLLLLISSQASAPADPSLPLLHLFSDLGFFSSASASPFSHILLGLFSSGLMLMTHHPTWKHFPCGGEESFAAVRSVF